MWDITQNKIPARCVPQNYAAQHDRDPKPLIWTAKASDILQEGHPRSLIPQ
jgi:hypothetical protein